MIFLRHDGDVVHARVVARVEVVGLRGELGGQRVDLRHVRLDAVALALRADVLAGGLGELADHAIGEAELLGVAQERARARGDRPRQLVVHAHHLGDGVQEPLVDAGQLVDLVDGDAVFSAVRRRRCAAAWRS
jgi:hypothetical protein